MKQYFKVKISFVFVVIATLFQSQLFAQTPSNGIIFQAVARDQYSNPAKDRKIFVQSSIIQSSVSGVKVLLEEHETTTDASGVFSISVGNGKRIGGTVTTLGLIDWSQGPYYLNLKIAITPIAPVTGWDYTKDLIDLGTSPFGTVPYALYAGNVFGLDKKLNIADSTKYVTPAQLAAKTFDQTPILNSIATKLNIADSITKYVTPTQLATKTFDSTAIYNQLSLKANTTTVNTALATKLNIADSISKYVTPAQLAAKTFDSTAIYNQLALKANTTDVTTALGLKANTTDVNTALGLKANTTDVNTALGLKANTTDVTTALSTKENTANKSLDVSLDGASDVKFPSVKAIKTYVDASIVANTTPLTFSAPLSKSGFTVSIPQANGSNNGYLNSTDWTSFNNKIDATQKAANNGVATLGNDGKIPSNQIPAISFQNVSVVNSSSAMTSISGAQVGSIAIRTDNNNNYVLSALPSSTLSNWIALATPIYVSTVNGFAGPNVVLTTNDVSEGANNKYYTDARVRGALSATAPLTFNSTTGAFAIPQASTTADGFLSATDWNTFKNKQNALVAGTDYVTPSGTITGNAGNVTGIVSVANGGTGSSTAVGALANLGAEPTANKSNDVAADAASTIKFPSVKAIKDYVDLQSANAGVADNSLTSAKINGTIAIGKGGTGASTAAAARTNLGLVIGTDVMSANFTTTLTGDVTGSGNGSFATTVNSVGGITAATIAGLPTSVNANTLSITANTNSIATINTTLGTKADLASPAFTGVPTSPTPLTSDNSTKIATTEYVKANLSTVSAGTLTGTTLASTITGSSLTSVGTITSGTWSGSVIGSNVGGAGSVNGIMKADGTGVVTAIAAAPLTGQFLTSAAGGTYTWTSSSAVTGSYVPYTGATGPVDLGAYDLKVNGMTIGKSIGSNNALNIAFGTNALQSVTTSNQSIAIGYNALQKLTTGYGNTSVGSGALPVITSGAYNVGIGMASMYSSLTPNYNVGVGNESLYGSNGNYNIGIGYKALKMSSTVANNSGTNNIGIGSQTLGTLTSGAYNTIIGDNGGNGLTTGSYNTIIGAQSGTIAAGLSKNIILSDGQGTVRAQHNGTTGWTLGTIVSGTWSGTTIGSNVGGAGSVNGIMKADGSGVVSAAVAGTDYQSPLTAGSGISINAGTISVTGLTTSNLASNAAITNSQLANSTTTLGSTTMTLGGTVTSVTGLSSVTATNFSGALTGNVTGDVTGNLTGNATTATTAGNITATSNSTLTSLSNLNTVGTITTGVWSATEIAIAKGGTGATTASGALTNLGAEATANKSTATDLGGASTSDVFFPSQKAVKTYVDAQTAAAGVSDGSITSAKITDGTIVNADVSTTAAIAFSKLNIAKSDITALGIQESLTAGSGISINAGTISATGLTTSNLASNAAITNAQLANSTTTLGSTTMTLGGTITSVTGLSALSATNLTGALTGNASTATALATGRTISTTGDITYSSGSFDGSGDVTGVATLAASGVSSGTYGSSTAIPVITVDTKGRITSASTVGIIAGVNSLNYTSTTSYAAGGTISGTSLTLAAADATNPGLISTGAQTIAGAKTFSSDVTATNFLGNATTATTAGNITATSNTSLTSITNLATVGTITAGTWSATEIAISKGGTGATTASGARTNLGLGSIATKSTIADADVDASAAIAFSKLNITKANITGLGVQEGLTAGSGISISAGTISATGLTTSNLASNAAITNAQLANSTTTLGSTTMTLGGTVTSVTGLTSVSSTGFTGALTGNASTATKLATTKNINGVAFDGSADITVAADANTLTGTTLASNVVNSSLTSVGTITQGVWSGTAISVTKGGTGATTKTAAFDALSPMTTSGDIIYGSTSGTGTRLAKGTDGQLLTLASGVPAWTTLSAVTSLGTFTTTAYAAGGTINGSTLTLSAADGTKPGLVSTVAQTIAGAKTFSADILTNNDVRVGKGVAGNTTNTVVGKLALGGTSTVTNENVFNTAIGISTMQNSSGTGSYNTAVGANSAFYNNSGSHNTYLGYQTGYNTTSGAKNVAIGSGALYGSTTGNYLTGEGNNAIGFEAMKDISTTAADNIAIGLSAGTKLTTGTKNIFIGSLGGKSISTGSSANTTGLNSVLIGYDVRPLANGDNNEIVLSGYNGTAGTVGLGSNTTLIGSTTTQRSQIYGALTVVPNTATGAGNSSTIAAQNAGGTNTAGGALNLTAGNGNGTGNGGNINLTPGTTSTGTAGKVIVNGGDMTVNTITVGLGNNNISTNTALGYQTLNAVPSSGGGFNTAIGYQASLKNTSGSGNVSLGYGSLVENTTSSDNTAVGVFALNLLNNGASSSGNVAIGSAALKNGQFLTNNTAVGTGALSFANGVSGAPSTNNTALGFNALNKNTTGNNNIGIGSNALFNLTTASNNTAIGVDAGSYFSSVSNTNTTGTNGVFLGFQALPSANGLTNEIVIGANSNGNGSNTTTLGNGSTLRSIIYGSTSLSNLPANATSGSHGGDFNLTAQNGTGTNRNGGNINLTPGTATGTGAAGLVRVTSQIEIDGGSPGAGKVLVSDANGVATWQNSGGSIVTMSATGTATSTASYIIFTGSTASQTITIPSAVTLGAGRELTIKNVASVSVSIASAGGNLIQDNSTLSATTAALGIEPSNNWMRLVSDGTNWYIFRALF